jgi:ribose-phosphate pyrophosphokinase
VISSDALYRDLADSVDMKFFGVEKTVYNSGEIKPLIRMKNSKELVGRNVIVGARSERENPSANDLLMESYFLAKRAGELGAGSVEIIMPWLPYPRQHEPFRKGEPISLRYVMDMLESSGIKTLYTVNSHLYGRPVEESLQSFVDFTVNDLSVAPVFSEHFNGLSLKSPLVVGPDKGSQKMVSELAARMHCRYECLEKTRDRKTGKIKFNDERLDVNGRDVIIFDDEAQTGGTQIKVYHRFVKQHKPRRVFVALAHLIGDSACEAFRYEGLYFRRLVITDSFRSREPSGYQEVSVLPILREAIKNS